MDLAALVPLVAQLSIALIVFSIGLQASPGDLGFLFRWPSLLVRSILAMNVVMPLVALGVAAAFQLRPAVEVALIVLAVSPVPPILPKKQMKAGGTASYAIGLLAVAAALSIVAVPTSVAIIGLLFGRTLDVPTGLILKTIVVSILGPLVVGVVVARIASGFAKRAAGPLSKAGTVLLLVALVPILVKFWPAIAAQVGDFTLVAIALFTLVSLAVGHALGGPNPDDRTVLALSTACRHPAIALAVAGAVAATPEAKGAVSGAILLAVLLGAIVTVPYAKVRGRRHTAAAAASSTTSNPERP